jgi:hypothetical protein
VELESLAQFGDAEFVDIVMKLLKQVERVGYGLDDLFGFVFSGHGQATFSAEAT